VVFLLPLFLRYPKKKIGKPRKEIGNLNGCTLMILRYHIFSAYSPLSIKVISMGTTLFPSMARLALP
jgi:hypothetical protein